MRIAGLTEEKHREAVESSLREMEALSARIRDLIASQPPLDLLGYIHGQRMLAALHEQKCKSGAEGDASAELGKVIDDTQFILEYVHAVLASTPEQGVEAFDEVKYGEIFACATELKAAAFVHAMATSAATEDGAFGPATADVEFRAKCNWIVLRGNRYQVLESEFFAFVLAPHDGLLRETYGMTANEIAAGFQSMANALRTGPANAMDEIWRQVAAAHAFGERRGGPFTETLESWAKEYPAAQNASLAALGDLMRGGICNVSRHTKLPADILADLAFTRGEEKEFYAEGAYCGTPLRTLPARKKPLIKLGDEYYGVDPCFTRDSSYRALLWNLLQRRPDYKSEFEARQKDMGETAFVQIFDGQLRGAKVNREVWYRDPKTGQWVENDTLIRIDDVLLLVEGKAGAAATIASPATDFPRHVRAVQDLVVKAYTQCKRFFDYLNSADDVPIFKRRGGRYVECDRLRIAAYRLLLPIGLTVESFAPFSTMCKELPDIVPLLGRHAFLSLSIDDLFVLKRFLPTTGDLAHYLEVRQAVAGMKGVHLFDELDHLGAYITKNRFDQTVEEQRAKENPDFVVWDGMSSVVDHHFATEDWETRPVPTQDFPAEVLGLLGALNRTRAPGWLAGEAVIRDYSEEGRKNLAGMLNACRKTLDQRPSRFFQLSGSQPLFVWLQRTGTPFDLQTVSGKACAAALAAKTSDTVAILAFADVRDGYVAAERFSVDVPVARTAENAAIFDEAKRMLARQAPVTAIPATSAAAPARLPGRNEPCWCGSGLKFKKCHGR